MEDKIKKILKDSFPKLFQDNMRSFSNLSLQQHVHNTSDSKPIPIKNILIQNAIQFPNSPLPAPMAGMIAFNNGTFYKCLITGTWVPF